jgi:hypothetical protein
MRYRNQPSDKLDAALDGRPVEVDDELAPLLETAAKLRAALTGVELDPQATERHLGMVLDSQAEVVPLPTRPRPQASRWRRRLAAVALAAALTVLPATMASASALPGQALYPVKLAIEQLRVTAVVWSSVREANERIKITDHRLGELDRLVQLNAADRIPPAIVRLSRAYVAAQQAVREAVGDGGDPSKARALDVKLAAVTTGSAVALQRLLDKLDQGMLPASARQVIIAAIQQAPGLVTGTPQPTPTTAAPIVTTPPGPQTTQGPTTTTQGPTTTTQAPTTTTQAPTTTTQAPTTTTMPPEVGDSQGQDGNDDSGQGSGGDRHHPALAPGRGKAATRHRFPR